MLGGFLKNIGNIYHDIIDILVNKLPGLEEYCWDQRLCLSLLILCAPKVLDLRPLLWLSLCLASRAISSSKLKAQVLALFHPLPPFPSTCVGN